MYDRGLESRQRYALWTADTKPAKVRIARESFIEQLGRLRQLLPCMDSIRCIGEQRLGAQVKIVCEQIGSGCFLDRRLFAYGDFCLKLVRDLLGNLALNGEYVR